MRPRSVLPRRRESLSRPRPGSAVARTGAASRCPGGLAFAASPSLLLRNAFQRSARLEMHLEERTRARAMRRAAPRPTWPRRQPRVFYRSTNREKRQIALDIGTSRVVIASRHKALAAPERLREADILFREYPAREPLNVPPTSKPPRISINRY